MTRHPSPVGEGLEVRATRGRGRGLFTTRARRPGELLSVAPVLRLDAPNWGALSRTILGDYLFRAGEGHRDACVAFGPVSLVNHDPHPNAELAMSEDGWSLLLVARTEIDAETEVTIAYRKTPWFEVAPA